MIEGFPQEVVNKVPMTCVQGPEGCYLYLVNTMHEWRAFYELLMQKKLVMVDTETSGFQWFNGDRIVGMSFGWGMHHFYIPVRHEDSELGGKQPQQLNMDDLRDDLVAFFEQKDVTIVLHNITFDKQFFRADGIESKNLYHDTMIWWQLYDENAPAKLKKIATGWRDEFGFWHKGLVGKDADVDEKAVDKFRSQEASYRRKLFTAAVKEKAEELQSSIEHQDKNKNELKKWVRENMLLDHPYRDAKKDDIHYGLVPIEIMFKYAAMDTFLTYKLYRFLKEHANFKGKQLSLYINELKLTKVLQDISYNGAKIDRKALEDLGKTLRKEMKELHTEILEVLGDINLKSTQQLASALVEHGVPLSKTTDKGALACDADVLKKFENDFYVVKKILEFRKMDKLLSTYVESMLNKLTDDDLLHASFRQNVSTGRLSISDPNLSNIPGGDDRIRRAFICPSDEYVYVLIDYSQVEVRLTAHVSQDPLLLDAYKKNQDVHTRTMCEIFNFAYNEVIRVLKIDDDDSHPKYKEWKILRTAIKRVVFGIIYGIGAPGLTKQLDRPDNMEEATEKEWMDYCQSYIDAFLNKYKGVARFISQTNKEVQRNGVVYNSFGRARHLPAAKIKKKDQFWRVRRAQRQATNYKIQGEAADIFKTAVVRVYNILDGKKSYIINLVHDEIQLYMHKSELHLLNDIKKAMEDFDYSVPLVAEVAWTTTNWAEKKEM